MRRLTNNIIYRCLYLATYLVSLLPMWILYKVSKILYTLLFHLISYRKAVVIQNLSRSFPEKNYQEIENIMKQFYLSFCDNLVEILKSVSISPSKQMDMVELINFDIIKKRISENKNVIACMGHCGNWEVLNILPEILDINCCAVYKPLKIKCFNKLFLKLRSRFGMQLIPSKSVVRHFMSNKNAPSAYFFLSDQCPKIIDQEYRFNFLHQATSTFSGIEKLTRSSNSAVVYIHVIKISRGMYRIECKDIIIEAEQPRNITYQYIQLLEQNIQEQPHSWLWSHKRWKR